MVISQFLFYLAYQHLTIPSLKHYLTPKHLPHLQFFLPFWLQLLNLFFLVLILILILILVIVVNHLKLLEVILEGADGVRLLRAPQREAVLQEGDTGQS